MNRLINKCLPINLSLLLALLLPMAASVAQAQSYPNRPIRVIVPWVGGGAAEALGRVITTKMAASLGQPIVLEAKSGANGEIGTAYVAAAAPDGYTVLLSHMGPTAISPALKSLPYDPLKDLAPVAQVAATPLFLVIRNDIPVHNIKELVAYAKANPGKLTYGSVGIASSTHLAGEILARSAGIDILHVPYRGSPPIVTDMIGGRVAMGFFGISAILQHVQAGQVRLLGIASLQRSPAFPDVPAISEVLPGFEVDSWFGLMAPAGTPKPIIAKLQEESAKALKDPSVIDWMTKNGFSPRSTSTDEHAAYVKSEMEKWAKLIRTANIKLD